MSRPGGMPSLGAAGRNLLDAETEGLKGNANVSPARGETLFSPWREPREQITTQSSKPRPGRHSVDERSIRASSRLVAKVITTDPFRAPPTPGAIYFCEICAICGPSTQSADRSIHRLRRYALRRKPHSASLNAVCAPNTLFVDHPRRSLHGRIPGAPVPRSPDPRRKLFLRNLRNLRTLHPICGPIHPQITQIAQIRPVRPENLAT
jgi:hypothetical protein